MGIAAPPQPPAVVPNSQGRGLRSFERSWRHLEAASVQGDALALAAASADAARAFIADGDADEAHWHLQRGQRFLSLLPPCGRGLALQCELAALGHALATLLAAQDEQAARRLRDTTRDAIFDLVRRAGGLAEGIASVLQAADLLHAMGDTADAQTLRQQALQS
jgi:hypothetical protein